MPKQHKPPTALSDLQQWFSDAVMTTDTDKKKENMATASRYIKSSKAHESDERLLVYINDYWPRLLDSLSEDFPLLKNTLGNSAFTGLMKAYLNAYPSTSFTLHYLPKHLCEFIEQQYNETNKALILDIARYEWAYRAAAFAKEQQAFNPNELTDSQKSQLLALPLRLQAHVHLLNRQSECSYAQPDSRKTDSHYCLIARQQHKVVDRRIPKELFELLGLMKAGASIEDALNTFTQSLPKDVTLKIEENIEGWFAQLVQEQLLVHPQ